MVIYIYIYTSYIDISVKIYKQQPINIEKLENI